MKIFVRVWLLLLFALVGAGAFALEAKDIKFGESFEIDSKIMGEKRTILVYLPASYAENQSRYPVLYLTDGEAHALHTSATVNFLADNRQIPEMIVVGVTNTDRTRDLTPTASKEEGMSSAGGAEKFIKFFEQELFQVIEQRYRTAPYKVFAGHSLGGLLAVHTWLTHPAAFDAYIAVSPSLWWDDQLMRKKAQAAFAKSKPQGVLFMGIGDENKDMMEAFAGFKARMEQNANPALEFGTQFFNDEDHGSVVLRSHYHGLKKVFAGWKFPRESDFQDLQAHFAKLSKRMKYTVLPPEGIVNNMGYYAMSKKKFDEAIEILSFNTRTYPGSANTYDSLCEALDKSGKLQEARVQCEKAVALAQNSNHKLLADFKASLARLNDKIKKQGQ